MRALGPGSVSSFLKIALDVVHVVLWIAFAAMVIAVLVVLVAQPFVAGQMSIDLDDGADPEQVRRFLRSPFIPALVAIGALYIGGLVFIVGRLRRVFVSLAKGDPFEPLNVRRLRLIGFTLGGIEILSYFVRARVAWWEETGPVDSEMNVSVGQGFNLTIWFAVLVVFVLAEVFREGARLRREAELTI